MTNITDGSYLADYVSGLERENAKLRELVRDMYADVCAAYVGGRPLAPYQFADRMRELGVDA